MIFQIIQNHLFLNNALAPFQRSGELTHTWNYSKILKDVNIEYAHIWTEGNSLDKVCPYSLQLEWAKNKNKINAFIKSFQKVGLDVSGLDCVNYIPEKFIKKYLQNKNQISEHVFTTHDKPKNYEFMLDLHRMIAEIKEQNLNIDLDYLKYKISNPYMRNLWNKVRKNAPKIAYNPYGTITGRLGVQPGSFPILNVSREARRAILPNNDCFVELDFNAAELRVLLALNGKDQPENDIHEWNAKNVFKKTMNRDEIKKKTFSWLYNPKAVDKALEVCYNKNCVKEKYFDGSYVETIFDRKIETDDHHALNYIIQSTTSDLFLKRAIKIWKMLKGRKSNVAFTIHDSLAIDFHLSDKELIQDLIEEFSNTELGKFKVNVSGGKNFGNMKKMDL